MCSPNIPSWSSLFLYNTHVRSFVDPPWTVYQHTNRIKVHFTGLWSMHCVNTTFILFQHLKFTFVKVVFRVYLESPRLQLWIIYHILTVRCVLIHHIGSLKRANVLVFSKLCVVTHIWSLDTSYFDSKVIYNW